MRKNLQSDSDSSDAQPYILGRPDLNDPVKEDVARLEPSHPSEFRTHGPDLLTEESRLVETIRTIESTTPETQWTGENSPQSHRKPIALIAISLAVLVTGTFFGVRAFVDNQDPGVTPSRPPAPSLTLTESASAAELRQATEEAVRGFMEASNFLDRSQFVFGGPKVAEKMRMFYQRPDTAIPHEFGEILDVKFGAFDGIPLHAVAVAESNGRTGWHFNLFPTTDRMLIDWESSVAYGEKSWSDLLKDHSTTPVAMRVYLKRSYRFAEPFEERSFEAFEVSARGSENRIFAYVPRDSDLSRLLSKSVPMGASRPVHIRLQWPSTNPDNLSIEIVELIHDFWVDAERLHRSIEDKSAD